MVPYLRSIYLLLSVQVVAIECWSPVMGGEICVSGVTFFFVECGVEIHMLKISAYLLIAVYVVFGNGG